MTMISSLTRFGRRQLHTIVSTQTIKPSSPTPTHLKTYNLSVFDQYVPNSFVPLVTFYPNTSTYNQILDLKNSLSHTLTKFFPFAGRHAKVAPTYIDCNDQGAEFIEASIDSTLSDFLQNSKPKDLDQLYPYGRTWSSSTHDLERDAVIPLAVQLNRFECGGVGVAVSLSHKIGDAYSLIHFLIDWAKMTRLCSNKETCEVVPINPHFISYENTNINFTLVFEDPSNDCVTRSFVFPNDKINELKRKVSDMIPNPTRVEVLTWLLYKCAVRASTAEYSLGSFKPAYIHVVANLRDKMIQPLPENSIGNFITGMEVQTNNETELMPGMFIGELRNQKKKVYGIKNIEAVFAPLLNKSSDFNLQRKVDSAYMCSSLCGHPAYAIDFGWGTPIKVSVAGNLRKNSFVFTDAPNGEGVEVLVCLGKQDMDIIQRDPELLPFAIIS